jgi:peptidyl-prolyl cis-trans isomerase A (cyclophilin A)
MQTNQWLTMGRALKCIAFSLALCLAGCSDAALTKKVRELEAENAVLRKKLEEHKVDVPKEETLLKGRGDYAVVLKTSKGSVVIEVHKSWAPNAASRFRDLTVSGYYNGCRFYRVVKDFTAQSGVNGDPKVTASWTDRSINDDPPIMENVRGTVCMARSGAANSSTTQFFINTKGNLFLKGQGYAPFGFVTEGIEVIDSLYSTYGECVPLGGGPDQRRVIAEGESYLKTEFPLLDQLNSATLR